MLVLGMCATLTICLGQHGIWNLHKRAYKRSALRSCFLFVFSACIAALLLALCDFLYVHH